MLRTLAHLAKMRFVRSAEFQLNSRKNDLTNTQVTNTQVTNTQVSDVPLAESHHSTDSAISIIFVSVIFFTFETLLIIGAIYLLSIPVSYFSYKNTIKKLNTNIEEDHEDVL